MLRPSRAALGTVVTRALVSIGLSGFVAGCAPAGHESDRSDDQGTESVMLTVDTRSEWRVLWVEGETDLPDGAEVQYRASHALTRTVPASEWPAANLIASGRATVQDGTYWAQINTLNWPRGEVHVVVQFPVPPQPPSVVEHYGEFGERLTGANVSDLDGMKVVELEHVFEHAP